MFAQIAPRIVRDLLAEKAFKFQPDDTFAIVGNLAHECGGFETMQEIKPTVKGSAGGYGWAQWTGPRRRAFFAWAERKGWHVDSYAANYSFLVRELLTTESGAVPAVKRAKTLDAKVEAFEMAYERAGVKHYASRKKWARRVKAAYLQAMEQAGGVPAAPGATGNTGDPEASAVVPMSKQAIFEAQCRLRDLKYHEVGRPDGKLGSRTAAAIVAFQRVEGLPETRVFDRQTLARLAIASPRVVDAKRAATTVADLRDAGSKTIKDADQVKSASKLQMILSGGVATFWGATSYLGEAWTALADVREVLSSVPIWVWALLLFGIAYLMHRKATDVQIDRRDDERSGAHAGIMAFKPDDEEPEDFDDFDPFVDEADDDADPDALTTDWRREP